MRAPNDSTAPKGLRVRWVSPPRSGMQRIISPWEYRHLRAWAGVHIASGIALVGLGAPLPSRSVGTTGRHMDG
jgi:hypothetical protein